jgi:transcriptional regulator with XRE-family HTH domain
MQSLGQLIAQARKRRQLSQKELASRIQREDGKPISPQYLNDIERDRRTPGEYVLEELAKELGLDSSLDWMYYLIGKWPDDLKELSMDADTFTNKMRVFRRGSGHKDNDMGS